MKCVEVGDGKNSTFIMVEKKNKIKTITILTAK